MKPERYAQILEENFRNRLGWSRDIAEKAASVAADVLRAEYGGAQHYIPARADRRAEIYGEFNGKNVAQLSRKYGVSTRTVARIVAAHRKK